MIMPNSVFGLCRCRCPENFHGPRCQFVSKRTSPRLTFDALRGPATTNHNDDDGRGFTRPSVHDILSQLHEKRRLTDFHGE